MLMRVRAAMAFPREERCTRAVILLYIALFCSLSVVESFSFRPSDRVVSSLSSYSPQLEAG